MDVNPDLFPGARTDLSLSGSGPTVTADDVRASHAEWAKASGALDEYELRVALLRSSEEEGSTSEAARDLLVMGRAAEAAEVLAASGTSLAPSGRDGLTWPLLVRTATDAACGDDDAFGRLLSQTSRLTTPQERALVLPLLGAAADAQGEVRIADDAWTGYVGVVGATERRATRRACVAALTPRPGTGALPSTDDIATCAGLLSSLTPSPAQDPSTVLETVDGLVRRGAFPAARLLLVAVDRLNPDVPEIQQAMRRLTGGLPAPRMVAVIGAVASALVLPASVQVAVALAVVLPLVLSVIALGFWLSRGVWWFAPGEEGPHNALAKLAVNPVDGTARPLARVTPGPGTAAILGFTASALVALPVVRIIDGTPGRGPAEPISTYLQPMVLLLAIAGVGTLVALAIQRRRASQRTRAIAARDAVEEVSLRDLAGHCRCWKEMALSGRRAELYVDLHLVPVPEPIAVGVRGVVGADAVVALCPLTRRLWLAGPLGAHGRVVALRGAEAETASDGPANRGFYL
ncbi:hypothetical protein [Actinotalea subterranea]|uniref:hypothetical protein n=1 Tax=Actinotalea subterranea TaxID=2607497 RepID=UPI0011EC81E4|nr:hypothetical protein [Actinotalea subterranea]